MPANARRLPIYLLVDTSGSMRGDPIKQIISQLGVGIDGLRSSPQALETVYLSLITFGSTAKVEVPLQSLETFEIPAHLDTYGSTAMGEALQLLCRTRAAELNRTTPTSKGDWRPMVFLFAGGIPTDDFDAGLADFKRQRWGTRVAFAVNGADEVALLRFLDNNDAARGTPDETLNLIHISTSCENDLEFVERVNDFFRPKWDAQVAEPVVPPIYEEVPKADLPLMPPVQTPVLLPNRRLPIYFLVDTSGSMQGDPINQVNKQLGDVINGLRSNPQALETAHLCLITFGATAKVEVPLTSLETLETFEIPTHLNASDSTAMGEALQLLCRTRAADLNRKTATSPGDYPPIVFLISDGIPTDDFDAGLAEFKRQRWDVRVACAVNGADEDNLRKFLDNTGAPPGTPDESANLVHISTSDPILIKNLISSPWVEADLDDCMPVDFPDSEQELSHSGVPPDALPARKFSSRTLILVGLGLLVLLGALLAIWRAF